MIGKGGGAATTSPSLRKAAPGIVLLARAGYAAKGVVYIVMGMLAARVATGRGGATTDPRGAVRIIGDGPMGTIALVVIGAGLLGYMAWRIIAAVTDAERTGNAPTKLLLRVTPAVRGLAYGALGVRALRELTAILRQTATRRGTGRRACWMFRSADCS